MKKCMRTRSDVYGCALLGLLVGTAGIPAGGWGLVKADVKDPALPKVLLIGDSILGDYAVSATRHLDGKATGDRYGNPYNQANNVWHKDVSGILATNGPYAVVHFNLGLHGYRKGDIPEGQFAALTHKCVETIRQGAPAAKIVWASTTPVVTDSTPFALHVDINPVIVAHNAMAAEEHPHEPIHQRPIAARALS